VNGRPVSLHDIADVRRFVCATLNASRIRFDEDEFEDLVGEGIAILYQLAETYKPHLPGYEQEGRFSGYAACYLPRRLGDVWHTMHPEHIYRTREDGSREYEYVPKAISLDAAFERAALEGTGDTVECQILPAAKWVRPRAA
jgi:hypothetical protein